MQGFDLSATAGVEQAQDAGVTVHVEDASGKALFIDGDEGRPVTITVAGVYSRRYRRAEEEVSRRVAKSRGKISGRQAVIEKAAACTLSWDGIFHHRKAVDCTAENAERLYRADPSVLDQVAAAQHDAEGFTRRPSTSS